jgi:DNA-binding HxlR family transcriptional regulator
MLEEAKIVKKKVFKETPPRTEYRLTEKGEALSGIINEVRNFGAKYLV